MAGGPGEQVHAEALLSSVSVHSGDKVTRSVARTLVRTALVSGVVLIPGMTGRRAELGEGLGHNKQRAPGLSYMREYFYISSFAKASNVEVSSVGRVSYSTCGLHGQCPALWY